MCGAEFCDWRPNEQWANPVVQANLAAITQPYLQCNWCWQIKVVQVGDADLVNV